VGFGEDVSDEVGELNFAEGAAGFFVGEDFL